MAVYVKSATGALVAKTTLLAASAAADAVGKTIVVTTAQSLSSNVTIPATIQLQFEKGGIITTTGYTLTIKSQFTAPRFQIFTGTGSVMFCANQIDFYPEWWGAATTDTTDDTSALQACIDAAAGAFRGTHTGSDNASVLTDSTKVFPTNELATDYLIFNITDLGEGNTILSNTATTVTATLTTGTDKNWDTGDEYLIVKKAKGVCKLGLGKYYASQLVIPYGTGLVGEVTGGFGVSSWGSSIYQVAATNKSLIVFDGRYASGYYWLDMVTLKNLMLYGDITASAGCGISFRLDNETTGVRIQDQCEFSNILATNFKGDGILVTGATPAKFSNIVAIFNDGYGMNVTASHYSAVTHLILDNVSTDANTLGGIHFEGLVEYADVLISGYKSEKRVNSSYSDAVGNDPAISVKDCSGMSLNIQSAGYISSVVEATAISGYEAPGPFISINAGTKGTSWQGLPHITWNGVSVRLRPGDKEFADCVMVEDNITARDVPITQKSGSYNGSLSILMTNTTDLALEDGTGRTYTRAFPYASNISSPVWFDFNDLVMAAPIFDLGGMMFGQPYVSVAADRTHTTTPVNYGSIAVALQNETGSPAAVTDPEFRAVKIPQSLIKNAAYELYNPASIADGAQDLNTILMPGSVMGDFTAFSFGVSLVGMIGSSYISTAGTASVLLLNETGTAVNLAEAGMWVYTFKDDAFKIIRSQTHDFGSVAANAAETVDATLPGARLGDIVLCSFSLDLQAMNITCWVDEADSVKIRLSNRTAGAIDLTTGTLRIGILDLDKIWQQ